MTQDKAKDKEPSQPTEQPKQQPQGPEKEPQAPSSLDQLRLFTAGKKPSEKDIKKNLNEDSD